MSEQKEAVNNPKHLYNKESPKLGKNNKKSNRGRSRGRSETGDNHNNLQKEDDRPGHSKQSNNNNSNNKNDTTSDFRDLESPAERSKRIVQKLYQRLERTNPTIMFNNDTITTQSNPKRMREDISLQNSTDRLDRLSISPLSITQTKKNSGQ